VSISNEAKKQILRSKTAAKFPFLIEITHDLYGTLRYVNSDTDVEFEGNTFEAASFAVMPPKKDGTDISNATLSISDIDQTWIEKIRSTQQKATIRFIAGFIYDEAGIMIIEALEDMEFQLVNATWGDSGAISWSMIYDTIMDINIPCDTATFSKVPGVS
jgi:hypothetical protein